MEKEKFMHFFISGQKQRVGILSGAKKENNHFNVSLDFLLHFLYDWFII